MGAPTTAAEPGSPEPFHEVTRLRDLSPQQWRSCTAAAGRSLRVPSEQRVGQQDQPEDGDDDVDRDEYRKTACCPGPCRGGLVMQDRPAKHLACQMVGAAGLRERALVGEW